MIVFVGVLSILVLLAAEAAAATDKVVCYYGSWSVYRPGNGQFNIEDINPKLCTHLVYTFVGLTAAGEVRILDPWNEIDKGGFARFNQLKTKNPKLKTLVAIGGYNEGSVTYSNVVASASLRATLVNNVVTFVKKYNFDGFDVDWEYPARREGAVADKVNYILLLKELRARFDKEGWLLTAAVGATEEFIKTSYNVPEMSKYLDFINVMTYDLHGSWDGVTGQNAPLYKSSKDTSASAQKLNVQACIQAWLDAGAPPAKLVLGIGVYGRSFTLASASNNGLGVPTTGAGTPGPYTQEAGYLGYLEICEKQKSGSTKITWDDEQKQPIMTYGNQWVGYDDPKSVKAKVDFAKSKGLGGLMIWSIETEDFKGICGPAYPILNAINSGISGSGLGQPEVDPPVVDPIPPVTQAPPPGGAFVCQGVGWFRDPVDCAKFYQCTGAAATPYVYFCPDGLYYDAPIQSCNWKQQVSCP